MKALLLLVVVLLVSAPLECEGQSRRRRPRPRREARVKPSAPPIEEDEPLAVEIGEAPEAVPEGFMERELLDLQQRAFSLSEFKDKLIVLNIWATWCGPCRVEIPELEKLSKEFEGRVEVIGLTTEAVDEAESVAEFVRRSKLSYKIGFIEREDALALMSVRPIIPQTFIIDRSGRVLAHHVGYHGKNNLTKLREAVRRALAATSGGR
jgi:thiol-disulfide isomerase/thioredoxin